MAREVDRLLAQLSRTGRPDPAPAPSSSTAARRRITRVASASTISPAERAGLWARLALGATLGGLMPQWPHPHGCGAPLAGYLAAVTMVMVAGVWTATVSWRQRNAAAHVLAVLLLLWGIGLAAERVLPRTGYAAEGASWFCAPALLSPS